MDAATAANWISFGQLVLTGVALWVAWKWKEQFIWERRAETAFDMYLAVVNAADAIVKANEKGESTVADERLYEYDRAMQKVPLLRLRTASADAPTTWIAMQEEMHRLRRLGSASRRGDEAVHELRNEVRRLAYEILEPFFGGRGGLPPPEQPVMLTRHVSGGGGNAGRGSSGVGGDLYTPTDRAEEE